LEPQPKLRTGDARVQRFVDRFRAKATKARQVQSRLKQLDRVQQIERERTLNAFGSISRAGTEWTFGLRPQRGGQELRAKTVYRTLEFRVERGSAWHCLAKNGAGKSTLLKILAGVLRSITVSAGGYGLSLHYFAQHQADRPEPGPHGARFLAGGGTHADLPWLRAVAGTFSSTATISLSRSVS